MVGGRERTSQGMFTLLFVLPLSSLSLSLLLLLLLFLAAAANGGSNARPEWRATASH
jgi:hypothetical protein